MIEPATDAILLKRFVETREEAAFAELVDRYGPRVQRECRRYLRSEHDVEEVFQATFLLLALRAPDVAWRTSIGGWVCDAARRLALHARGELARRGRREIPASCLPDLAGEPVCTASSFTDEVERRDVRRAIDRAMDDLPEKYRDPLVLCYLKGKTNHEAAAELGYPVGSISRRLDRARGLLRTRLINCGVLLGIVVAMTAWIASAAYRTLPNSQNELDSSVPHQSVASNSLRSPSAELEELLAVLQRTDGEGLDRVRLDRAVDHAREAARFGPVTSPELADEARSAALELAWLIPDKERAASTNAASRLLSTCVQCHVALH